MSLTLFISYTVGSVGVGSDLFLYTYHTVPKYGVAAASAGLSRSLLSQNLTLYAWHLILIQRMRAKVHHSWNNAALGFIYIGPDVFFLLCCRPTRVMSLAGH